MYSTQQTQDTLILLCTFETAHKLLAPFGWSENRKYGKRRKENRGENDVFPCLVQERKHKGWKTLGKKSTRAHKFLSSRFGRKTRKKREKREA